MRLRLSLFSVVACLACRERVSARLEVDPDTLALYGSDYSWVTVKRVDADGISEASDASLTARDLSVVRTSGTSLACLRDGTTTVDVLVGPLTTSFVARCEIAARLDAEPLLTLEAGGAPHSLAATAIFSSGDARVLRPISALVNDTSIAVVRDDAVVPLAIGHASVRIDYGGLWSQMGVDVRRTVLNDTIALAAGETRDVRLDAGRYTISVNLRAPLHLGAINMETEGLRCSRDSRDEDTIHCVASEPAVVTFRNTSTGASRRRGAAFVRMIQVP